MMNEFNNVFNNSDRNNIFFPDDDIFTLYLNSEDNVRNINGGNYMSDIKVNNTNNGFGHHYNPDNIFNPADQEANKVNHDISKGSFKTPEVSNAKINIDCKEKLSAWSTYSKNQVFSNSFTNSINNAQVQQHQQQPNKMCNINGYGQPIINHNLVSQNTVSGLFTNPAGAFTSTSGNNLYNNFNKPFPTSSHSVNKLIDLVGSKQQLPIDLKLEQSSTKNTSFESKTYKQNNNSTSSLTKYKINSKSCSSLSEKDLIFKTTKVKRQIMDYDDSDKSDEFEEGLDPMQLKLQKNRVAAKKSRQKRKIYIQNLEERVKYLETELDNQKKLYEKQNKLNDLVKLVS